MQEIERTLSKIIRNFPTKSKARNSRVCWARSLSESLTRRLLVLVALCLCSLLVGAERPSYNLDANDEFLITLVHSGNDGVCNTRARWGHFKRRLRQRNRHHRKIFRWGHFSNSERFIIKFTQISFCRVQTSKLLKHQKCQSSFLIWKHKFLNKALFSVHVEQFIKTTKSQNK